MINSRNEIVWLLEEYMDTYQEYISVSFGEKRVGWDEKRVAVYFQGVVLGKYEEMDVTTMQVLKNGVTNEALYNEIKTSLEYKIEEIEKTTFLNKLDQIILGDYKNRLKKLSCDSIDKWIDEYCKWETTVIPKDFSEFRTLIYLYYSFDNYKNHKSSPFCSDIDKLEKIYNGIFNKQSQFFKYGIVPINAERELLSITPPRIYDRIIDRTFFTKNVPLNLLKQIANLLSEGYVKDFSVRLKNHPGCKGKSTSEYIKEALERGKKFDLANLGDCSVSRFFSKKYEDCMWIVIDFENITFEELCEDFETYDNMIVTQVVHLQYKKEMDCVYITHLDHEYVFYTIDEYERRMGNATQKGAAQTRMKSFKIDNSKIPFNYKCKVLRKDEDGNDLPQEDVQFLCFVLETYFKHKDLLKEYFQEVLK